MSNRVFNILFIIYIIGWVLLQLMLVLIFKDAEYGKDAIASIEHTLQSYKSNSFYPTKENLYDIYVQAPGLVNYYLLPIYIIFHNVKFALIINVLLNLLILLEIFYVSKKFFNRRTAYVSCILYSLILSNIFAPITINSEVFYLFLALSGFCLSLSRKWYSIILSGLLYAIAYTVKPLIMAFFLGSIAYILFHKVSFIRLTSLIIGFILPLFFVGLYNKQQIGYFSLSSSTGGYNLLMTANDKASPLPNHDIHIKKGEVGYDIRNSHFTFVQRDSLWKDRALKWIKQHPFRYLTLCIERIAVMYNKDTWSIPSLFGDIDNPEKALSSGNKRSIIIYQLIKMGYSFFYYITCVYFLLSLIKNHKQVKTEKGILLIILILGIGGTCLFPMEHRYHYPYMFIITIWASFYLEKKCTKIIH